MERAKTIPSQSVCSSSSGCAAMMKRLWVPPKLPVTITSVPLQTEMVISTFYPRTCAAGSRTQSGQAPSRIAVAAGKECRKVNLWRPDQLTLVAEIAIFGTLSET